MVTAQRDNTKIVRNSSFYKPIRGYIPPPHRPDIESYDYDEPPESASEQYQQSVFPQADSADSQHSPISIESSGLSSKPTNAQQTIPHQPFQLPSTASQATNIQPTSTPTPPDQISQPIPANTSETRNIPSPNLSTRPVRTRKAPGYLKDYVTK